MTKKLTSAQRRQYRTRNKLRSINIEQNAVREIRPRLSVFRSGRGIYAQIIDDIKGVTLAAASTVDGELKGKIKNGSTKEAATKVGELIARRALKAGVTNVLFDRGRFLYHGRVKALADGARDGGLQF